MDIYYKSTVEWAREGLTERIEAMEHHIEDYNRLVHDYAFKKVSADEFNDRKRNLFKTAYEHLWLFHYGLGDDPDLESYIFDAQTYEIYNLLELGSIECDYDLLPYLKRQLEYYLRKVNEYEKIKESEEEVIC